MDAIFLGVNDVGMRIYEWLCDRADVEVRALLTEQEQLREVKRIQPDIIVSVGFDHLVPTEILSVPSRGAVNLHPSLLPYNRGKSPNVWPIVEGTPAGVTLHYMDKEFDTGDIIAQQEVEIKPSDTGKDLFRRLEKVQFELFTDVWSDLKRGDVTTEPQDRDAGTYHTTDDFRELCELDTDETVRIGEFFDRVRALTFPPFDNAYVEVGGDRYYIDVEIRRESDDDQRDGLLSSY